MAAAGDQIKASFPNFSDQSFCSVLTSSVLGNDVVVVVAVDVVVVAVDVVVVAVDVVVVVVVVVADVVEATLFLSSTRSSSLVVTVEVSQLHRGSFPQSFNSALSR